jgi:hypothetical protein
LESIPGLHKSLKIRALVTLILFFDLNTSTRARIFKLLRSPRIDSKEPRPPGWVVWLAGIRKTYSYSVPCPHRLLKNSSTETERLYHAVPSAQRVLNNLWKTRLTRCRMIWLLPALVSVLDRRNTGRLRKRDNLLTAKWGEGVWGSQIIGEKSLVQWSSRNHIILSASGHRGKKRLRRNLAFLESYQKCFSLLHQLMEVGEGGRVLG